MLPISIDLELTYDCNQRCSYCYNFDRINNYKQDPKDLSNQRVSIEDFKKLLLKIKELKIFRLNITGGEPLLRKDLVIETLKFCQDNNIDAGMNSNFLLITEEDISEFIKLGLKRVTVPISSYDEGLHDSITNIPNSFRKVTQNIKLAKQKGLQIGVNMVVSKLNISQVYKTGVFVKKELGVDSFFASVIHANNDSHKKFLLSKEEAISMLDVLLKLKSELNMHVDSLQPFTPCMFDNSENYSYFLRRHCSIGANNFVIRWNGDIKACIEMPDAELNIFTNSYDEIVKERSKWIQNISKKPSHIPVECFDCAEIEFCRGGCRTIALATNKSINSKYPYMREPLKKRVDKKIRLINFIKKGFHEKIENIKHRKEDNKHICSYNNKIFILTNSEFALFKIIIFDQELLKNNIIEFAKKYNLELNEFNKFLNKIATHNKNE